MFNFSLVVNQKSDSLLTLTLSWGFRIVFIAIAVFIAAGMFTVQAYSAFPIVLLLLSVLAGLYNESWLFNKQNNTVEHRLGLLFLYRRKTFDLSKIQRLELRSFSRGITALSRASKDGQQQGEKKAEEKQPFINVKGLPPLKYYSLHLIFSDGSQANIETAKTRYIDDFYKKADALSEFLDVSMIKPAG